MKLCCNLKVGVPLLPEGDTVLFLYWSIVRLPFPHHSGKDL